MDDDMKKIKAWAVWNTELNLPCVLLAKTKQDVGDGSHLETMGAAIWIASEYGARQDAITYLNSFSKEERRGLGVKLKKIEITIF